MSAQPMTATRPVSITVTHERVGVLVSARATARRAFDFLMAAPRRVWASLVKNLHLHSAQARIAAAGKIVSSAIANARAWLGTSGQIGVGLGLVATPTGRAAVNAVIGAPMRLIGRVGNRAIDSTVDLLDKLGSPGHWLGNKIESGREALWGKPTSPMARMSRWVDEKVAPHLRLDTWQMRSAADVSEALISIRLMRIAISHSGFLMAGTVIAWLYALRGVLSNTVDAIWTENAAPAAETVVGEVVTTEATEPVVETEAAPEAVVVEAPKAETPAAKKAAAKAPTKAEVAKAETIKEAAEAVITEVQEAVEKAEVILASANGVTTKVTPPPTPSRAERRAIAAARRKGTLPEVFDTSKKIVGQDAFA